MIDWRTERPQGSIIVAKLTKSFTYSDHSYKILFWNVLGNFYDYAGEEVPFGAIEKWALIEE